MPFFLPWFAVETHQTSQSQSLLSPKTVGGQVLLLLTAVWVIGFLWFFFNQTLPNNSTAEQSLSRADLWLAIAHDPFSLLNPFDYSWSDPDAGWEHLPQRVPHAFTAALIWLSAWGWGIAVRTFAASNVSWRRSEAVVVDMGVGLALMAAWVLLLASAGWMNPWAMTTPGLIIGAAMVFVRWKRRLEVSDEIPREEIGWPDYVLMIGIACFGLHLWLGTMTPAFDFDVREYHLQGPKEWFQAGRLSMLSHNVYTSFPFLSEMLSLLAMAIRDDPWEGAISGKAALGGFSFLAVTAVYAIASRLFDRRTGLLAALILISTPWLLRVSIIAYAESAITFYLIATVMVALRLTQLSRGPVDTSRGSGGLIFITGLLAGGAMASKYPGVVSVVIPVGLWMVSVAWQSFSAIDRDGTAESRTRNLDSRRETSKGKFVLRMMAIYACGVFITVGPWLIRNTVDTGNPVYPLVWSVFGGADWDESLNEKWNAAHSAPDHNLAALPLNLKDVALRSDWQNGLLFAFAIPVAIMGFRRRELRWLSLHAIWLLGTWWLLTHRIDRFWVPMIPVLAVIASAIRRLVDAAFWRAFVAVVVMLGCVFNYAFGRLDVIGFHAGLSDLDAASERVIRDDIKYLNAALPDGAVVLMVGEAEVFDCRFQTIYNTVFDASLFQQWTSAVPDVMAGSEDADDHSMKSSEEIRQKLRSHGVTHVYVNWSEILRYRLTYGYTPYVTPERFQQLVEAGVLLPGNATSAGDFEGRSDQQRQEVMSWNGAEALLQEGGGWTNRRLYRVR